MSDARALQPKSKTVDLTSQSTGQPFWALIKSETYHGIKPEVVYPEELTVTFKARDFAHAVQFAQALATIIQIGHDVHRSHVELVAAMTPAAVKRLVDGL